MGPVIAQLARALRARETSALELTQQALAAARSHSDLNAFITLDEANALEAARRADATPAPAAAPLAGIPFVHKDIFCTKGVRTTCASRMLGNFVPPYDATVAERLNIANAV